MAINLELRTTSDETAVQKGNGGGWREVTDIRIHGPYGPKPDDAVTFINLMPGKQSPVNIRLVMSDMIALRNMLDAAIDHRHHPVTLGNPRD